MGIGVPSGLAVSTASRLTSEHAHRLPMHTTRLLNGRQDGRGTTSGEKSATR